MRQVFVRTSLKEVMSLEVVRRRSRSFWVLGLEEIAGQVEDQRDEDRQDGD